MGWRNGIEGVLTEQGPAFFPRTSLVSGEGKVRDFRSSLIYC